jgi:hypothetical protein
VLTGKPCYSLHATPTGNVSHQLAGNRAGVRDWHGSPTPQRPGHGVGGSGGSPILFLRVIRAVVAVGAGRHTVDRSRRSSRSACGAYKTVTFRSACIAAVTCVGCHGDLATFRDRGHAAARTPQATGSPDCGVGTSRGRVPPVGARGSRMYLIAAEADTPERLRGKR